MHKLYLFGPFGPFGFFPLIDLLHLLLDFLLIEHYPVIVLLLSKALKWCPSEGTAGQRKYLLNYHNQIQMMNQSQQKMLEQLKESYEILTKFGFPSLLSSNLASSTQQLQNFMEDYLQPTAKRENMIQWLILNINSLYAQELESKGNKKRKILNNLWKLGVLPYNKHTSNLDYERYVQGLLGYQQSLGLIHTLCKLLRESRQFDKAKPDAKFGPFLQEIINNFDNLVNLDYDPYKVSFPSAYQSLSDEQFNKEYEQTAKKIMVLKGKQKDSGERSQKMQVQSIFNEFQQSKAQFAQKYSKLIQKIKQTLSNNENLIANYSESQSPASRTLKVSESLPKIYRQYKEKIKLTRISVSRLAQERRKIQTLFQSLNQNVCL